MLIDNIYIFESYLTHKVMQNVKSTLRALNIDVRIKLILQTHEVQKGAILFSKEIVCVYVCVCVCVCVWVE